MGTIIYTNLVDLILRVKGKKTEKEITDIAIKEIGFPDNEHVKFEIKTALWLGKACKYYELLNDKKYKRLMANDEQFCNEELLLKSLNGASDEYFQKKPHLKKLKEALEKNI